MTRYVAFLRGVSPMNAKMPELKKSFEAAGFDDVKTVLSSGNVVFSARPARAASEESLQRKAEAAMEKRLGRAFMTIVRSVDALREIIQSDPFASFRLPANAKRVVTFLRERPKKKLALPIEVDGAKILCVKGSEVYTAYVPSPKGASFMVLIEKTFGADVTTRTWATVEKVAGDRLDGEVDAFMSRLDHPRKAEIEALRKIIRGVDRRIEESIKWNAPSFAIGDHFATMKLRPGDTVQIVFHTGAKAKPRAAAVKVDDPAGLLKWAAKDRCVATLADLSDTRSKKSALVGIVKQWIAQLERA